MNNLKSILAALIVFVASFQVLAQTPEVIKLEQTPGSFTTTELTLKPGQYKFEVLNNGVDHEVGFVVAPKGKEKVAEAHLAQAYLTKTVVDGESAQSNVVELTEGTYSYFCPLNPTPLYTLVVEGD